jgi:hypothetical protein
VIGPPIAFALAIGYGFEVMYLASALAYVICAFVVWRWLPSLPLPVMDSEVERVSSWRDPSVRALFIASTLMWTCNSMYLINMPLYITRELGLEEKLAGFFKDKSEEERGKAVYFITEEPLSPVYCRLEPVFYSLAHAFGIKSDEL